MRRMLVVVLVLCAVPAFANDRVRVSVFLSNPAFTHSEAVGTNWTGGVGAGVEYRWTPRWSGEVSVATEQHAEVLYFVDIPPYTDGTIRNTIRSYPIDFVARRHLFRSGRLQPYIGGGARWVEGPSTPNTEFDSRV
ncbi:MAG TPA: outer membrane beta-barrel protein, partial [Thermoanaerobaculia bacterium]|nr:outer membrane beta-barrel protein [Thermoanaerobaculia bacterium]